MVLVDSLYINNSGGKVLLDYLVSELEDTGGQVFYLFDERCKSDYSFIPDDKKFFLKASLLNRLNFYRKHKTEIKKVFCFGNIPPPLKLEVPLYTYFHNVSLISQPKNYSLKEKMLKMLKFCLIKFLNQKANVFIVQSNTVRRKLQKEFAKNQILVLPFYKVSNGHLNEISNKDADSFVYISNGNTHKNHKTLLDAWEILAKNNLYPKLHLTITNNYEHLINRISSLQHAGLQIINHGFCNPDELYRESKYLIYPSLTESFGLGLIEAVGYRCEVIASDLPYVFEICRPFNVFDPSNSKDIAAKVEGALTINNERYITKPIIENKINEIIELLK